jgi:hypothetical protein
VSTPSANPFAKIQLAPIAASAASAPVFSFGSAPTKPASVGFSFGATPGQTDATPTPATAAKPSFSFGVVKPFDAGAAAKDVVSVTPAAAAAATTTSQPFNFSSTPTAAAGAAAVKPIVFDFSKSADSKPADSKPAEAVGDKPKPVFQFGAPPPQKTDAAKPVEAAAAAEKPKPVFQFGAPPIKSTDSAKPVDVAVPTADKPKPVFAFGAPKTDAPPVKPTAAVGGGWKCAACEAENGAGDARCSVCLSNRPAANIAMPPRNTQEVTPSTASTPSTKPAFSFSAAGKSDATPAAAATAATPSTKPAFSFSAVGKPDATPAAAATAATPSAAEAAKPPLMFGFGAGAKPASTSAAATTPAASDGWKCAACEQPNEASAVRCSVCMSNKPTPKPTAGGAAAAATAATTPAAATAATTTPAAEKPKPTFNFGAPVASKPAEEKPKPVFSFGAVPKPDDKPTSATPSTTPAATPSSKPSIFVWLCAESRRHKAGGELRPWRRPSSTLERSHRRSRAVTQRRIRLASV